jgi:hypothetical protein
MEKKRTKKKKKKKRQLFPPLLFLSDTHDHNTHTRMYVLPRQRHRVIISFLFIFFTGK